MAERQHPLDNPELELRAHVAGVNFATQMLLHLHDDLYRSVTGYSPDWVAIADHLMKSVEAGDTPLHQMNRRGREIAANFMLETDTWSRAHGSPGPAPKTGPQLS
ncbi:MAG TPA: hypothetical protein VG407_09105 [Caulobacteraceae bacterium]|jgi:hypothetical protein|nr:hypothetical protein [Caulobacteraceae bacterium]